MAARKEKELTLATILGCVFTPRATVAHWEGGFTLSRDTREGERFVHYDLGLDWIYVSAPLVHASEAPAGARRKLLMRNFESGAARHTRGADGHLFVRVEYHTYMFKPAEFKAVQQQVWTELDAAMRVLGLEKQSNSFLSKDLIS